MPRHKHNIRIATVSVNKPKDGVCARYLSLAALLLEAQGEQVNVVPHLSLNAPRSDRLREVFIYPLRGGLPIRHPEMERKLAFKSHVNKMHVRLDKALVSPYPPESPDLTPCD